MKTTEKNGKLILIPPERIDTTNAPDVEKEIMDAIAAHPGLTPAFDMTELQYISSAGLRVLMKVRKLANEELDAYNVSSDVYEIMQTTGFTDLLNVKKKIREISVEGCPVIGEGGFSKVYRIDPETIVKIYRKEVGQAFVEKERNLSQKAFIYGVPTAISYDVVSCGESFGVVYELLNTETVAEIISGNPERIPELGFRMGKLLKEMHGIEVEDDIFPDKKQRYFKVIEEMKPFLEEDEYQTMIRFVSDVPDQKSFLHGDFHAKNIMLQDNEFLLIDIGDSYVGHPIFDVATSFLAFVLLPKVSARTTEQKSELLGFPIEYAEQMWGAIVSGYFDTRDPAEIGKISQKILPFGFLQMTYQAMMYSADRSEETMRPRIDHLVRGQLLPAIRNSEGVFF